VESESAEPHEGTPKDAAGLIARVDRYQQRHRRVGFPVAVIYKYADDQGGYLAALIAYYGLISLFPLLLLLSALLGVVLAGDAGLQHQVLSSATRQFPVIGTDLGQPKHLGGGTLKVVVGLVGALYGGLGVAQALQNAMNVVWAVPRNCRPNPLRARGRSLLLVGTAGLAVLATTALTAVINSAASISQGLGVLPKAVLIVATVAMNAGIFAFSFRLAGAGRGVSFRQVAVGALVAAAGWAGLLAVAAAYVRHVGSTSSVTYGVFGLVLGLIAFLYLASVLIVLCMEIDVVRTERLYPRALLTPFTDQVVLTAADERTYTGQAEAQRAKGFQEVDVTFAPPPGAPRPTDEDPPPG
jgi:YihY family inner membrane protein